MKNVLISEDISAFGKCSTTVGLPIISTFGMTGTILPTTLLSTHTGPEFPGFTALDLTDEMVKIIDHWKALGIKFDAIYTGYLGKVSQIDLLLKELPNLLKEDGKVIVDPVFGDHGNMYPGFDETYAKANQRLVAAADLVVPNYTEACFIIGKDYESLDFSQEESEEILKVLQGLGAKNALLTGIRQEDKIGATILAEDGSFTSHFSEHLPYAFHGTGDIFASTIVGEWLRSEDLNQAVNVAVDFVPETIKATVEDENPITYGVHFEKVLPLLNK